MLQAQPQPALTGAADRLAPGRLLSLDVLRGLTVAGMILVTDPGNYAHVFTQLTHARWDDPTATDLIFPCFLVMVGVSMTLSFAARLQRGASRRELALHAVRRSAWLVVLGLLVNGFPAYHLATLRIPGILQRIGACYLIVSMLYLGLHSPVVARLVRVAVLALTAIACLVVYWLLLKFYPTPGFGPGHLDPLGNIAAVLDRAVFTVPHMFQWGMKTPGFGITFDPEGILSTLGALGTTLCGVIAGEELRNTTSRLRQCATLATAGTALWLLSLGLRHWMPLNKQIYTPPFALWSAGLSLIAFAALLYLIDIRHARKGWTLPLIFGTNAIFAFFVSQFVTSLLQIWRVPAPSGGLPLYMALNGWLFEPWLPPRVASLTFALCIVLLNAAIVYPLFRKRVFLRL